MMQQPMYIQILQWANWVISILYPVVLVCILFLAWKDFRRLVDHFAPRPVAEEKSQAKKKAKGKEEFE